VYGGRSGFVERDGKINYRREYNQVVEMLDRFQGCLVGLAVGDALGGPLEFMSPSEIVETFGGPVREMMGGGWLNLRPGEYTDDTQMMLCIAESIVAQEAFEMEDVAHRFLAWYKKGPRDIGKTTRLALEQLARGVSWREAGMIANQHLHGRTAGNGSLMRCAPIGLYRHRDYHRLIRDSMDSSCVTHWDARAGYSVAALNLAIAELVQGRRDDLVDRMLFYIEKANRQVRKMLKKVEKKPMKALRPSGYVIDTLEAALWCFLRAENFEEALISAVNLGGDADTVGAVCGALAGAHYGLESIPRRWIRSLEDWGHISNLAARIYALVHA
jgi:ADP-ribosyl-[dinitrogen reductase] hydrolase